MPAPLRMAPCRDLDLSGEKRGLLEMAGSPNTHIDRLTSAGPQFS